MFFGLFTNFALQVGLGPAPGLHPCQRSANCSATVFGPWRNTQAPWAGDKLHAVMLQPGFATKSPGNATLSNSGSFQHDAFNEPALPTGLSPGPVVTFSFGFAQAGGQPTAWLLQRAHGTEHQPMGKQDPTTAEILSPRFSTALQATQYLYVWQDWRAGGFTSRRQHRFGTDQKCREW